jgi:hypothetical protein
VGKVSFGSQFADQSAHLTNRAAAQGSVMAIFGPHLSPPRALNNTTQTSNKKPIPI